MTTNKSEAVTGSRRVVMPGAKALGPANQHAVIDVLVKVRRKKELGALEERPKAAMTRDAVGSGFGASDGDIKKVADTFQKLGLQVVSTNPVTRSVELSGTVAEMENAFQVKLFDYEQPGDSKANYRGRVGDLFIPPRSKALSPAFSVLTIGGSPAGVATMPRTQVRRGINRPFRARGIYRKLSASATTSRRATAPARRSDCLNSVAAIFRPT